MRFWIDTEFNQTGGDLISIAMACEDGSEFYAVLPCDYPKKWIRENVIPILNEGPVSRPTAQRLLSHYLSRFEAIEVIADHPADILYFSQFLIVGDEGQWLDLPPIGMSIDRSLPDTAAISAIPHNALEDAKALRKVASNK